MKYYELNFYHNNPTSKSLKLYGEGGLSWYFKTDLELKKEDILKECLKQYGEHADLVEAAPYLEEIVEISSDEFYQSI